MKTPSRPILLVIAVAGLFSTTAGAAVTTYTSLAAFNAATTGNVAYNFEGSRQPRCTLAVTEQWAALASPLPKVSWYSMLARLTVAEPMRTMAPHFSTRKALPQ